MFPKHMAKLWIEYHLLNAWFSDIEAMPICNYNVKHR